MGRGLGSMAGDQGLHGSWAFGCCHRERPRLPAQSAAGSSRACSTRKRGAPFGHVARLSFQSWGVTLLELCYCKALGQPSFLSFWWSDMTRVLPDTFSTWLAREFRHRGPRLSRMAQSLRNSFYGTLIPKGLVSLVNALPGTWTRFSKEPRVFHTIVQQAVSFRSALFSVEPGVLG